MNLRIVSVGYIGSYAALKIECTESISITEFAKQLVVLMKTTGVMVDFKFNCATWVRVSPSYQARTIVSLWKKAND